MLEWMIVLNTLTKNEFGGCLLAQAYIMNPKMQSTGIDGPQSLEMVDKLLKLYTQTLSIENSANTLHHRITSSPPCLPIPFANFDLKHNHHAPL